MGICSEVHLRNCSPLAYRHSHGHSHSSNHHVADACWIMPASATSLPCGCCLVSNAVWCLYYPLVPVLSIGACTIHWCLYYPLVPTPSWCLHHLGSRLHLLPLLIIFNLCLGPCTIQWCLYHRLVPVEPPSLRGQVRLRSIQGLPSAMPHGVHISCPFPLVPVPSWCIHHLGAYTD